MWGFCAQMLNIWAGLILIPLAASYVSVSELNLWINFVTIGALIQMLDFGFQQTVARNVTYVFSGATQLLKNGFHYISLDENAPSTELLSSLFLTAKKFYKCVTIVASFILLSAGSLYIYKISKTNVTMSAAILSWFLFVFGCLIQIYFCYFNCFIHGRGDIILISKAQIYQRLVFIILGSLFLILNFKLIGLTFAFFVSTIVGRLSAYKFFKRSDVSFCYAYKNVLAQKKLFNILWHNSSRLGSTYVAAFFINRSGLLVASYYLGLKTSANYSLTSCILLAITACSLVPCQVSMPKLSLLNISSKLKEAREIYNKSCMYSALIFLIGILCLFVAKKFFLSMTAGPKTLLNNNFILIYGFILFLEVCHSNAANFLTTLNKVYFTKPAIISAISVFLLSLGLVKIWGVFGIILSQGIVQLLYNNWKWPFEVHKHFKNGLSY